MDQLDLLKWEQPGARNADPSTSLDAANHAAKWAHKGRLEVLILLMEGPMTDFQLSDRSGKVQSSIGKRRGELRDQGYVEIATDETGQEIKGVSPTGSACLVWRLTASGRAFFEQTQGQRAA